MKIDEIFTTDGEDECCVRTSRRPMGKQSSA